MNSWNEGAVLLLVAAVERANARCAGNMDKDAFMRLVQTELDYLMQKEMAAEDEAKELSAGTAQVQPPQSARRL